MWQAQAPVTTLKKRAELLTRIRTFFESRGVYEVDVPVLGEFGVTDPHLDALTLNLRDELRYLQTSPEYFMKRLLAGGSGDIYYLGKAFRADEQGRLHHHEFTLLEWYRVGWDEQKLIQEIFGLVSTLAPTLDCKALSYERVFETHVGVNPHTATAEELAQVARDLIDVDWEGEAKSTWLDVLFSHVVEPQLQGGFFAIYDYPECQAALAKIGTDHAGCLVAKRFECFLNGIELANGYWELTDMHEQKRRFERDNQDRLRLGKPSIPSDKHLLSALEHGLPECAGVAVGIDRLLTALLGLTSISEQRAFDV